MKFGDKVYVRDYRDMSLTKGRIITATYLGLCPGVSKIHRIKLGRRRYSVGRDRTFMFVAKKVPV